MNKCFIRLLFFLFLFFTSCFNTNPKSNISVFSGTEMTIDYRILIGKALTFSEQETIENLIRDTFTEVDQIYNKWNPDSEISQLNRLSANTKQEISAQLFHLLEITDQMVKLTEGRFDPSIEPLQKLWKTKLHSKSIPSDAEIQPLLPAIGWNKIHFENLIFWKDHDLTSLDLGGIAKGYCVDLLVERFNASDFPNVYVEWGGEIRASGEHPDLRPWNIFISRLGDTNPEHAIAHLSLINQAIATSGDYLQNWQGGSSTFFHVINPQTNHLMKIRSDSIASTSVLAPTCAEADALATALMVFSSLETAQAWTEKMKEVDSSLSFWIVSRSIKN